MQCRKIRSRPSQLTSALAAIVSTGTAIWGVIIFVHTGSMAWIPLVLLGAWLATYYIHDLVIDGTS